MSEPKHGLRTAIILAALVVLAVLVMDFNSRMAELRRLTAERAEAAGRLAAQEATRAGLQTQMAYANSDAAVEKWAYEDGHMSRPGDKMVVPLQSTAVTPTPAPVQVVVSTPESNWQRWWALFFGPRPGEGTAETGQNPP